MVDKKECYKSRDIYKFYRANYKNTITDYKLFITIIKEYYQEILKLAIYNNFEFKMPFRIGSLLIKAKPSKVIFDKEGNMVINTMPPDWLKTKEYWRKQYPDKTLEEIKQIPNKKLIRHLNEHSNGKKVLWYWDKLVSNLPNQSSYRVDINRTTDRELAKAVKDKLVKYYE